MINLCRGQMDGPDHRQMQREREDLALSFRCFQLKIPRSVVVQVCDLGWKHEYHVGACWKCKFSGSTPDLLNPTLWGVRPSNVV